VLIISTKKIQKITERGRLANLFFGVNFVLTCGLRCSNGLLGKVVPTAFRLPFNVIEALVDLLLLFVGFEFFCSMRQLKHLVFFLFLLHLNGLGGGSTSSASQSLLSSFGVMDPEL